MTRHPALASAPAPGPVAGVLTITDPSGVGQIRAPGIAGLIWQRRPLASFREWIEALDPGVLPRTRAILGPGAVGAAVTGACDSAGTPEGPERARLIDDIAALAGIFAGALDARWLRLRLEPVATDACRRFHVDRVTARLVCTYRGTGTQYGLAAEGEPEVIHTVPTGAAFIMRGTLWPAHSDLAHSGPTLRHRSPPIGGTGETRLMLALDPVTDPEEAI